VLVAHGYNHIFGGGKIAGTASWFAGLGMRPGWLHAWTASLTELGAGVLLILGLLTPLASAGVIGTMTVALVTNHLRNGFFIFRPGEGYEYVLTLMAAGFGLGCVGPGHYSLDYAARIFDPPDVLGLLIAVIAGFGGAGLLMVTSWRPGATARPDTK
jgi:putative oxidoreductase